MKDKAIQFEHDEAEAACRRNNEALERKAIAQPKPLPTDAQNHELNAWSSVNIIAQITIEFPEQTKLASQRLRELADAELARVRKEIAQ